MVAARGKEFLKSKRVRSIVALLVILVASQGIMAQPAAAQSTRKKVLTTFTVIADMAANVAGDKLDVESITKPGAEIHHYEPTPSDIVRALNSDLILDSGLGLETWAERFYANLPSVPHITLTTGITPIIISGGPFDGKPNPHAWMSPANALVYVENIRKALTNLDPGDAATFSAHAQAYSDKIRAVDQYLRQALSVLPDNERTLVSCEGAFSYLTHDYGMGELYLWAVNSDQEGTPQQIKHVIDGVTANHIPAVFCESTVNDKAQQTVAAQTGARFGGILYVDSLTGSDGPAPTYLKMLTVNAQTIISGLLGDAAPPMPPPEAADNAATLEATASTGQ
jgi:manganese transport system substrate-binding protein